MPPQFYGPPTPERATKPHRHRRGRTSGCLVVPEGASVPERCARRITAVQQPLDNQSISPPRARHGLTSGRLGAIGDVTLSAAQGGRLVHPGGPGRHGGRHHDRTPGSTRAPDYETGCLSQRLRYLALENTMIYHTPGGEGAAGGASSASPSSWSAPATRATRLGRMEWLKFCGIAPGGRATDQADGLLRSGTRRRAVRQ